MRYPSHTHIDSLTNRTIESIMFETDDAPSYLIPVTLPSCYSKISAKDADAAAIY